MLSKLQNDHFKNILVYLKKNMDAQDIEKEHDKIKNTLKTLAQVTNLNQILALMLGDQWFNRLCELAQNLRNSYITVDQKQKNFESQENLLESPLKSLDQNRQNWLSRFKKTQLTPSTKKSKMGPNPTLSILMEQLVQKLQNFDQINMNSKRIKLLIQQLGQEFNIQSEKPQYSDQQTNFEGLWKSLSKLNLEDLQTESGISLSSQKTLFLKQLFTKLQKIHLYMQVIRLTARDIYSLLESTSINEVENQFQDDSFTKKSNNPSEHRSLLTQMLRDSSQNSNIENHENECYSQVVLKLKHKQFSQQENLVFLDQDYRMSSKSVQLKRKSHILLKSQMVECQGIQNKFIVKKKQVKAKKSSMGCSQCEIF